MSMDAAHGLGVGLYLGWQVAGMRLFSQLLVSKNFFACCGGEQRHCSGPYFFGVKRVIHITLMKLMLITNIQYKEVGNVSQLLLKCINPSLNKTCTRHRVIQSSLNINRLAIKKPSNNAIKVRHAGNAYKNSRN